MRAGHFWGSGCVVAVACWGEGGEGGFGLAGACWSPLTVCLAVWLVSG